MDIMQILQGLLIAAAIGALSAAIAYLKSLQGESKVRAAHEAEFLAQEVASRQIQAAEVALGPKEGQAKQSMAERGFKAEIAGVAKAVGKTAFQALLSGAAARIQSTVARELNAGKDRM